MMKLCLIATLVAFVARDPVSCFTPSARTRPPLVTRPPCSAITYESRSISPGTLVHLSQNNQEDDDNNNTKKPLPLRRALLASSALAGLQLFAAQAYAPSGFKRIPTQFIAALGDPNANSGTGAKEWGLWQQDPGPRRVWLRQYKDVLVSNNNMAPAGWKFDKNDWWLEEHGLIMEAPQFPIQPGRYLVTGGRMVTTGLVIDDAGNWKLEDPNAKLYDVTHLPCRSARYHPNSSGDGSPLTAKASDFPVAPGAVMPNVAGCDKQDYAVLFLIGKEA